MKKLLFGILATAFLVACNGGKTNTNSGDSGPNTTNVQNVNGNQPDTTTGITLDTKQSSSDTTTKDTMHR